MFATSQRLTDRETPALGLQIYRSKALNPRLITFCSSAPHYPF